MSAIVLGLVDEHFIHGSIAGDWCDAMGAKLIIVVNDALAHDKMHQGLLDMSVPSDLVSRYYTQEKALRLLPKLQEDKPAIIIVDQIHDLLTLIDAKIEIPKIVLACSPGGTGKRNVTSSLALSDEEYLRLHELKKAGIAIEVRCTPNEDPEPSERIAQLFEL